MKRRQFLGRAAGGAAVIASPAVLSSRAFAQSGPIRIGVVAHKTGPLAAGEAISHTPNIELWSKQINDAGGLMVDGGRRPIEIISYDDKTNPGEHVKAVQRLAAQDKVDYMLSPYGTAFNVAAAPIYARYGYPLIAVSAITDKYKELSSRFPGMFFTLGSTTAFVEGVRDTLSKMRDAGQLGNKIAMVNVADAFGIELADAARPILTKAGFELVYDRSYPLGTPDLSPVMKGAVAAQPDAFVAWSYPPDTFGLTEQAIIENLDVKAYYTAVATSFPAFAGKFGSKINGNLGAGGVNPDAPKMVAYRAAHEEATGKKPDYWASATYYASLQVLAQAIEGVGTVDRQATVEYIASNSFDTVLGDISFDENNFSNRFYTVGQWRDGVFRAVSDVGMGDSVDVVTKEGWS